MAVAVEEVAPDYKSQWGTALLIECSSILSAKREGIRHKTYHRRLRPFHLHYHHHQQALMVIQPG